MMNINTTTLSWVSVYTFSLAFWAAAFWAMI